MTIIIMLALIIIAICILTRDIDIVGMKINRSLERIAKALEDLEEEDK